MFRGWAQVSEKAFETVCHPKGLQPERKEKAEALSTKLGHGLSSEKANIQVAQGPELAWARAQLLGLSARELFEGSSRSRPKP